MPKPLPINTGTPSTRPPIYNSLIAPSLRDAIAITDPGLFEVTANKEVSSYVKSVADQINTARKAASPPMWCVDLHEFIAEITIETSAQGSGVLTVDLIDPGWQLFRTQANGESFLSVDEFGYLWPPIEINFPADQSDALWRLCQVTAATDTTNANMSLVFEDAIVAELREHDQFTDPSCAVSRPNETRAEYIRRCVKTASKNPDPSDTLSVGIRFIPLLPNSVFTADDLLGDTTTAPTSALKNGRNFTKAAASSNKLNTIAQGQAQFQRYVQSIKDTPALRIKDGLGGFPGQKG